MGVLFKNFIKMGLIVVLSLAVSGCVSSMSSKKTSSSEVKTRETTAVYYDFDDILIPKDLQVVDDATVVVSTPGYTSGIIALKGRVDKRSLFNFFTNNMLKDNWSIVSQIKSPGSTIMVFQKSARWAVITIRERNLFTYVEVGVAPTINDLSPASGSAESETDLFN
ncbi:MAG: hypothetical protein U9N77_05695 [Thermodesulfobacteriota bacterium]|nr:hypothetical protein [Thermodesulfobacteriota bacterium]